MKKRMVIVFATAVWIFIPLIVSAEVIHLKTGKVVEGKLINKTAEYVEVEFNGTPIKYYLDEIDMVDGQAASAGSPAQGAVPPVVSAGAPREYAPADKRDLFGQILSDIFQSSKEAGWTGPLLAKATDKFTQFSKDNPNSRFAKDAEFMGAYCLFNKALLAGDKEQALLFADEIGKVAARYPDALLEEFTCRTIQGFSSDDIFIPFKFASVYLQGLVSDNSKDNEASVKSFEFIRANFFLSRDIESAFIQDVYQKLMTAYDALKKLDDVQSVRHEVLEKYPDSSLAQRLKAEDEERAKNIPGAK